MDEGGCLVLRRQSPRSVAARWRLSPNIFDHCASLSRARSWVFPAGIAVAPDLAARITACRAAIACDQRATAGNEARPEEPTPELQSLMRISYADFCSTKKNSQNTNNNDLDPTN